MSVRASDRRRPSACGSGSGARQAANDFTVFAIGDSQVNLVKWGTAGTEATLGSMNQLPGRPSISVRRAIVSLSPGLRKLRHGRCWAGALNAPASGVTAAGESFFDIFLEIDGVEGEATAPGHKGSIEVLSWSRGVSQTAAGGGGLSLHGRCPGAITPVP